MILRIISFKTFPKVKVDKSIINFLKKYIFYNFDRFFFIISLFTKVEISNIVEVFQKLKYSKYIRFIEYLSFF